VTHPIDAAASPENTIRLSSVSHLRRRNGKQKKRSAASVPPPSAKFLLNGLWSAEVDAAVVLIVRVAVTAPAPEMAAGWEAEHVGGSIPPTGPEVTAHVIATLPENPPFGVIVTVEVAPIPGDATLVDVPLSVNSCGRTTVIATVAVSATPPELPVTVAV
jgi:hypothetical protein